MTHLVPRSGTLQAPQLDYVLLDGSGSMQGKWWETIGALRNYVEVLKSQNVNSHGILHTFDNYDLELVQKDGTLDTWGDLSDLGAHWGATPLFDAIFLMGKRLQDLAPAQGRCSIVIVTDGDENGSQCTVDQARAVLDWCRAQGWQVTFLGADFNNNSQARALGANDSNSVGVRRELLLEAGKSLGEKRVRHSRDSDAEINFNEDERKKFGGYLTDGSNGK